MSHEFESRVREAAQETPYHVDAFQFVLQAFPESGVPWSRAPHIDAAELCWRLHDQAIAAFGPSARDQLESWGIRSTSDFGAIVFALISKGLMSMTEQDALEDFQGVFEFDQAFRSYRNDRINPRQIKLSTLFVITSIAAIAFAGAAKLGFYGAVATLFMFWIGLIGAICLFFGVADRSRGWLLAVCIGIGLLSVGIGGFLAIIMM